MFVSLLIITMSISLVYFEYMDREFLLAFIYALLALASSINLILCLSGKTPLLEQIWQRIAHKHHH